MANQMTEEQVYEEARTRVKARKDFWGNFGAWAGVNLLLIIIWALTDLGGYPWFVWPLCIWGVFVLLHYLRVFVFRQKPESIEIQKEAEKIKREQG
ncbi:2TM domain-containing protein [Chloroflexota bacterium]